MQWSSERHGGFTAAERPFRPVVSGGPFGYERLNVMKQRWDADSLLNRIERMIRLRKECPEIGWGTAQVLEVEPASVLALRYDWRGSVLLIVHNLSSSPQDVSLGADATDARALVDALSGNRVDADRSGRFQLRMQPYGFHWFHAGERDVAVAESPR
jgi:maltose alpha-D-glucosyltransferase/alpha-amylase